MKIKTVKALASFNQVRRGDILAYSEEQYGPALRAGYVAVLEVEGDAAQLDGDNSVGDPDPADADVARVRRAKRTKASAKSSEVSDVEDSFESGAGEPGGQG
jgi:hypothetical protein